MDDAQPIIVLAGVQKVFVTEELETHALSDTHVEIRRGEYIAITGPSGCGKSTLLSILGLLETPTRGEYRLEGRRVDSLTSRERSRVRNQRIGFVFQNFNLIGDLSVLENVELPLTYGRATAAQRRWRAMDALDRVGMVHRAGHRPGQLSGGQQQRVAIARAVVGEPTIVLADEPTGNLDSENADSIMQVLRGLHSGGATICIVTHDPRLARHAGRRLELFDGAIVAEKNLEPAT